MGFNTRDYNQPLTFLYRACSIMRNARCLPSSCYHYHTLFGVPSSPSSLCHLCCAIFVVPSSLCHLHCAIFIVPSSLCHLHCAILRCAIFVVPSSLCHSSLCHLRCAIFIVPSSLCRRYIAWVVLLLVVGALLYSLSLPRCNHLNCY